MTEEQEAAIGSSDGTIAYVARSLEHAPQAKSKAVELRGFRTVDGHFICPDCAARMSARGCMLPRRSSPIWESDMAPTSACIGTPFHISTELST